MIQKGLKLLMKNAYSSLKRTKKLEIYYEHKPEARSILTEEQVMKLDNELSKDSTNEKRKIKFRKVISLLLCH